MVGLGGVHPPSVHTEVIEAAQVLPVDVACLGAVGVVDAHSRGVVHAGRPLLGYAGFGPCAEVEEQAFFVKVAVGLCLRAERRPYGDDGVCVHAVYVVHHLLRVVELRIHKFHGVPQVVVAPVLPVLYDAVEGHAEFAVALHHSYCLVLALVALAALPEAVSPEREHGH